MMIPILAANQLPLLVSKKEECRDYLRDVLQKWWILIIPPGPKNDNNSSIYRAG